MVIIGMTRTNICLKIGLKYLSKFETYEKAKETWFGRSTNTAQSHMESVIGPIITGLRKTDKLVAYPYSSYYHTLMDSLQKNSRLLIIGYSFGDIHFNHLLDRITRIHGMIDVWW